MKICFSCRVELNPEALYTHVNSDMMCMRCYNRYKAEAPNDTFEEWRSNKIEQFGFDPYVDRDTDIAMYASRAAALLPVTGPTLDIVEDMQERTGLDSDNLLLLALSHFRVYHMFGNC